MYRWRARNTQKTLLVTLRFAWGFVENMASAAVAEQSDFTLEMNRNQKAYAELKA